MSVIETVNNNIITIKDDFIGVKPIICIDCRQKIELPNIRIEDKNGYQWVCNKCFNDEFKGFK